MPTETRKKLRTVDISCYLAVIQTFSERLQYRNGLPLRVHRQPGRSPPAGVTRDPSARQHLRGASFFRSQSFPSTNRDTRNDTA